MNLCQEFLLLLMLIWIPMHDLEENSGVYFVELEKSLELIKKEDSAGLVNGPTVLNMMSDQKQYH